MQIRATCILHATGCNYGGGDGWMRRRESGTNILTRVSDRVPRIRLSVLPGELSSLPDSAAAFASGSASALRFRNIAALLDHSRMCQQSVRSLAGCQVTYALTVKGRGTHIAGMTSGICNGSTMTRESASFIALRVLHSQSVAELISMISRWTTTRQFLFFALIK